MTARDLQYLLVPEIRVSGFNAMGNPYVIGAPGPTALIGWGHALERELRGLNRRSGPAHPVRVAGTALAVKECDFDEGRPLFPAQLAEFDRDKANAGGTPAMVEEVKGHGRFALAVALDFAEAEEEEAIEDAWRALRGGRVADLLSRHGFTGGAVDQIAEPQGFDSLEGLRKAFRSLRGAALVDRADLLEEEAEAEGDALDRLLDAVALEHRITSDSSGGRSIEYRRNQPGWLVPYPAGFKAIEEPKERAGAVNGHPHAYAEPLLGIGEYVPTNRLAAGSDSHLWAAFWRPEVRNGIYAARPFSEPAG